MQLKLKDEEFTSFFERTSLNIVKSVIIYNHINNNMNKYCLISVLLQVCDENKIPCRYISKELFNKDYINICFESPNQVKSKTN